MKRLKIIFLVFGLCGLATTQSFEELSPKVQEFVSVSDNEFIIQNVRLIDGTGSLTKERTSVVVKNGRIVSVGSDDSQSISKVIDGRGYTLIPGLVMLHEHMFYPSGQRRYNTNQVSFPPLYLAG